MQTRNLAVGTGGIKAALPCAAAGTVFKPGTKSCCSDLTIATATDGCAGVTATTEAARYACSQNITYTCKAPTTTKTTTTTPAGTSMQSACAQTGTYFSGYTRNCCSDSTRALITNGCANGETPGCASNSVWKCQ